MAKETNEFKIHSIAEINRDSAVGTVNLALLVYSNNDGEDEPVRFPPNGTWPVAEPAVTALVRAFSRLTARSKADKLPLVEIEYDLAKKVGRFLRFWTPQEPD
ncbi:MAG: hypothetical protein JNG88_09845 [Phycisphaerales bacterium]|nr:hypothetical protein [Phycisphaerales bacterium]